MAITQTKVVNQFLGNLASDAFARLVYMRTGSGTDEFGDAAVNLSNGTDITVGEQSKARNVSATGSFVTGRDVALLFSLEPGEPVSQPFLQGEVGVFENTGSDDSLAIGAKLNSVQTKDNALRQRWRMGLSVRRFDGS